MFRRETLCPFTATFCAQTLPEKQKQGNTLDALLQKKVPNMTKESFFWGT